MLINQILFIFFLFLPFISASTLEIPLKQHSRSGQQIQQIRELNEKSTNFLEKLAKRLKGGRFLYDNYLRKSFLLNFLK